MARNKILTESLNSLQTRHEHLTTSFNESKNKPSSSSSSSSVASSVGSESKSNTSAGSENKNNKNNVRNRSESFFKNKNLKSMGMNLDALNMNSAKSSLLGVKNSMAKVCVS